HFSPSSSYIALRPPPPTLFPYTTLFRSASGCQLIVDEVHRPGLVRSRCRPAIVPQLGLDPALRRLVAYLQAQFAIDTPRLVLPVAPSFATKHDVNAAITVADANLTDLPDPLFEGGLVGATGSVVVGRPVEFEGVAGPADRYLPLATDLVDELALPTRLHSFRRITSCSISLSSDRSATSFLSLPFSSSSCFSRRISVGSSPSYFFFQLK